MTIDSHSSSLACVYQGVVDSKSVVSPHTNTQSCMCVQDLFCFIWGFFCSSFCFFFQKSACGDQIMLCVCVCVVRCVHIGGMPAPEQSPVTEEGLLLTISDSSAVRNMEADSTANNILASVKEQVVCFLHSCFARTPLLLHLSYNGMFKLF